MIEIWKDIEGYEGYYQISNKGRVKSLRRKMWNGQKIYYRKEIIMKNKVKDNRYLYVGLIRHKKTRNKYIHRLVCEAFIPNPKNKATVNHRDGDVTNNYVDNLEWATQSENNKHAYDKLGKKPSPKIGVKNHNAKLNPKKVKQIRILYETGSFNISEISRYYNVTRPVIQSILKGKTWTHV